MDVFAQFGPEREPALAGPLGLFITLFLIVVIVLLVKGMNTHIKRLNERVDREEAAARAAAAPVAPDGETADDAAPSSAAADTAVTEGTASDSAAPDEVAKTGASTAPSATTEAKPT